MEAINNEQKFYGLVAAFYSKTRDEIVERIKLRDASMSIFLSSVSLVGTAYGALIAYFGAGAEAIFYGSYLLVLICLQCRTSASVIAQHHVLIGAGESYLVTELEPKLRALGFTLPQWDSSRTMLESKNFSIAARSKGHQMLIVRIAAASALGFIVLQVLFGSHIVFFRDLPSGPELWMGYLLSHPDITSEVVLSIVATVVSVTAVFYARRALYNASETRRMYLSRMNAYISDVRN